METPQSSKAGVINFNILEEDKTKIWDKITTEYAKGERPDPKKLEKYARQLSIIFHAHDVSTQQMDQRDLAEALTTTNDELVKKNKNFLAQILEGTSGSIGIVTVLGTSKIIFSAAMGGQSYQSVAGVIDIIGKFGPLTTQSIDAIARASRSGDEAARLPVDHKTKTLTSNRNDSQGHLQNATSHLNEGFRNLHALNSAEDALWSAAAR